MLLLHNYYLYQLNFIMNTLNPYILTIQSQLIRLANWKYFDITVLISTVCIFFIIGRKTYQSKFSYILNTINDAQNEKRRLKQSHQSALQSLNALKSKLLYFKIFSGVIAILSGIYIYLNAKKVQFRYLIWAGAGLFILWTVVLLRKKYLQIKTPKIFQKLQKKTISTQSDIKQITGLLGEKITDALKAKFQRQIKTQRQQQELKECDLKKCYDEKHILKQLYKLYKTLIQQMQQMKWCEVCAQNLNIEANELKLNEVEAKLRTWKAFGVNISLQKKKQLTNKLLQQWKNLQYKLPMICKRGCCIKFRVCLQEIKKGHHEELKSLKSKLSLLK